MFEYNRNCCYKPDINVLKALVWWYLLTKWRYIKFSYNFPVLFYLFVNSEDEDFEDSEDDDSSSDEWSEQDELPEALLMQQDDQEKRSTTNGSSRSGSVIGDKEEKKLVDEVDGEEEEEEEDLQQIEDSSIEEVDKRRREKGSDRKCLTNVTLDNNDDDLLDYDEEDVLCEEMSIDWDSAPSEVVEQDMFRAISKPVSFCKFNLSVHFCLVVFYSCA